MMSKGKGKSAVLSFRVSPNLKAKFVEECKREKRTAADLGRILIETVFDNKSLKDAAEAEERKLLDMLDLTIRDGLGARAARNKEPDPERVAKRGAE